MTWLQTALDSLAVVCVVLAVTGLLVRDVRDLDALSWLALAALLHWWTK